MTGDAYKYIRELSGSALFLVMARALAQTIARTNIDMLSIGPEVKYSECDTWYVHVYRVS